jgi:hypothetical protein
MFAQIGAGVKMANLIPIALYLEKALQLRCSTCKQAAFGRFRGLNL